MWSLTIRIKVQHYNADTGDSAIGSRTSIEHLSEPIMCAQEEFECCNDICVTNELHCYLFRWRVALLSVTSKNPKSTIFQPVTHKNFKKKTKFKGM